MPEVEHPQSDDGPVITGYGIASAALGVIAVIAVAMVALIWTEHREDVAELRYNARAMQAAADWTRVLINMDKDNVEAGMAELREGTVGQLNADFDEAVEPYRELVQTLQSRTTGQIDSVAVETIHHAPQRPNGAPPPEPDDVSAFASRTDTVMVVATSVTENAAGEEPRPVRWNLRLDVSEVDGELRISRLEPIR